ncbi:YjiH family protein [Alkalibacter rhizosphaerae]|uniref:YjiH family protein n=1 Tax=Alkalibacter rhizosphaerae TaxID=2815577 RepID=A0A974XD77_9FIRM|nr:nucleoside recognition domain-containing protein [Alkalibacter rhizosphaerae]QSX07663.1 YjiH family protein [Alkalibacter rhizosphaerae]
MNNTPTNSVVKNFKRSSVLKFVFASLFGLFAFFVRFEFMGQKSILVDHIVSYIRPFVSPNYLLMMFLFGIFCVADTFFIKKTWNKNFINKIIAVVTTIGSIMAAMIYLNIGPEFFLDPDIGPKSSTLNGIASLTVLVAGLFLTFLVDFGLIEAVGVVLRPLMRPLFKTPGRASVIALSAFLGNFSMGHISTDILYKDGKFNKKEAAIIALGFCTPSVGIMLLFASLLEMMEYWNLIFTTSIFVTLVITFITIRLYPLNKKPLDYYEGATPSHEPEVKVQILKTAFSEGVSVAEKAGPVPKKLVNTFLMTLRVVTNMMMSGVFVLVVGLLLLKYTSIFAYAGYVFWPVFKIAGFASADISIIMQSASMSFLDMYLSVLIGFGQNLSVGAKFFLCLYPMTVSVFVSGFWPVVLSTDLPVKPLDLVVTWFLRMILTILIAGLLATLMF